LPWRVADRLGDVENDRRAAKYRWRITASLILDVPVEVCGNI
jgi:hypothetical protein